MISEAKITVKNPGPVDRLVIPVQPGATILRGFCGVGKSQTLKAIAIGLGSRDRGGITPRAGTKRAEIDCLGVNVSITDSRITRNGDLDGVALEEFSLADLIYPPVKDADAKNRYAIKSLLRITDKDADPAAFYDLLGGKEAFEKVVTPDAVKGVDLVDMAMRVKRAIESKARDAEAAAEREEAQAAAGRNAGDGLDLSASVDQAALQRDLEQAVSIKAKLDEQCRSAIVAQQRAAEGRKKLEAAGNPPNRDVCEVAAKEAAETLTAAGAAWQAAQLAAAEAKAAYEKAFADKARADDALKHACQQATAISGWHDAIEAAGKVTPPSAEEIDLADEMVSDARKRIETAAVVRAAKQRIAEAKAHQEQAAKLRMESNRLRDAARATDDVLSEAVASERFSVVGGVLMGKLPDGQVKPYLGLSDGERAMNAIAEKLDRARAVDPTWERLAIIDLEQRIAQDLPPSVQDRIFQAAYDRNCCVVTALVDDGPLRAEVWQPKAAEVSA